MRVVSMVPSWTETLLMAGADVVGRTRFCIHPKTTLPVVGGTKDWSLERVRELKPDLILLDREENPKEFGEEAPCAFYASHVQSAQDLPRELEQIAQHFDGDIADKLRLFASRWEAVLVTPHQRIREWSEFPGVSEWIQIPKCSPNEAQLAYVIWKNPWMLASRNTFIASMLELIGAPPLVETGDQKYPEIDLESLGERAVFLFSSEPYPFAKKRNDVAALKRPSALIDGEVFSWFGVRSLTFLESLKRGR